jgi:hypothetical protein
MPSSLKRPVLVGSLLALLILSVAASAAPGDAKQIFVPNSSEYVQFDNPNAVVDAIREVYDQSSAAKVPR